MRTSRVETQHEDFPIGTRWDVQPAEASHAALMEEPENAHRIIHVRPGAFAVPPRTTTRRVRDHHLRIRVPAFSAQPIIPRVTAPARIPHRHVPTPLSSSLRTYLSCELSQPPHHILGSHPKLAIGHVVRAARAAPSSTAAIPRVAHRTWPARL